jgi:hypothetical protein
MRSRERFDDVIGALAANIATNTAARRGAEGHPSVTMRR